MTTRRLAPSRTIIASFAAEHPRQPQTQQIYQQSHQQQPPPPLSSYDDGLYILHVASGPHNGSSSSALLPSSSSSSAPPISCALSNSSVQTHDPATLSLVHTVPRAHAGPISDLSHLTAEGTVVVTSGQDGYVRLFDLRQSASSATTNSANSANPQGRPLSKAAAEMRLPHRGEEALSVSVGYGGNLAAVGGSRGLVHFYDLRSLGGSGNGIGHGGSNSTCSPSLLGTYEDAHTEEVTRVRFRPAPDLSSSGTTTTTTTTTLVTAGEDGLVNVFDTTQPTEEAALTSVLNVGTPLREVGFFGPSMEGLYCLTGSETLSVWHPDSAQRICDFGDDLRARLGDLLAGATGTTMDIDYLVGCHWDGQALSLLAGNGDGGAAVYRVEAGSIALTHTLVGGHRGCVRGFVATRGAGAGAGAGAGGAHGQRRWITAGEDARLCEWNLDGPEAAAATASPTARIKSSASGNPSQRRGGPIKHARKRQSNAPY